MPYYSEVRLTSSPKFPLRFDTANNLVLDPMGLAFLRFALLRRFTSILDGGDLVDGGANYFEGEVADKVLEALIDIARESERDVDK